MADMQVSMFGGTGTGKTSLLTAMNYVFNTAIGSANVQLTPDAASVATLRQQLANLQALCADTKKVHYEAGIAGTNNERKYIFALGKRGSSPSLNLHAYDFPGTYIRPDAPPQDRMRAAGFLADSTAIVITIDAPKLMERGGKWDEEYNLTQRVAGLVRSAYGSLSSPRLVLLVPVKCERYMRDAKSANALSEAVLQRHRTMLNFLSAMRDRVAVVITPVQTVGGIEFSKAAQSLFGRSLPTWEYRRVPGVGFAPLDCDQPLRYILRFLLRLHFAHESQKWGWFNWVRDLFDLDVYLRDAVRTVALGCKLGSQHPGFVVVQGDHLLSVD